MPQEQIIYERALKLLESPYPASRNRHFAEFSQGTGKKAFRLYRMMLAIQKDLEKLAAKPGSYARLIMKPGYGVMELQDPAMTYRRACRIPLLFTPYFKCRLRQHFSKAAKSAKQS